MASERVQRQIDRLLDEAEEAIGRSDWNLVRDRASNALRFDPDNADALAFLAAADKDQPGLARDGVQIFQQFRAGSTGLAVGFHPGGRTRVFQFLQVSLEFAAIH